MVGAGLTWSPGRGRLRLTRRGRVVVTVFVLMLFAGAVALLAPAVTGEPLRLLGR